MSAAGKESFADKVAQNTKDGDTGVNPSSVHQQSSSGTGGTLGGATGQGNLAGATVGGYGDAGAGGMSGGIPGGTQGKSGQERQDLAGTGAGATGNESGDTAGRQIEGARGQGLSGQGGVF